MNGFSSCFYFSFLLSCLAVQDVSILTFVSVNESVTSQMKATKQCFSVVLFTMLYDVYKFHSVDVTL